MVQQGGRDYYQYIEAPDRGEGWYNKVDAITIGGYTMYEVQLVHMTPDGRIDFTKGMPVLSTYVDGATGEMAHKLTADPMPTTKYYG